MRAIDFSPLYRSTVGFDRMFSLLDNINQPEPAQTYPPYNIEVTGENSYRITMAVAGFGENDLAIEAKENTLSVKGEIASGDDQDANEVLFRGFQLADHVEVRDASLENGLLHIDLVREIPEAMKPRNIAINGAAKMVEGKTAVKAKKK